MTVLAAKSFSLTGDRTLVFGPFAEGDHWDTFIVFYGDSGGCYVRFGVTNNRASAEASFDQGATSLIQVVDSSVPGVPMLSNGIAGLPYGYAVFPVNNIFTKEQPFAVIWIRPVNQPSPGGVVINVRPGVGRQTKPPRRGTHIPTEARVDTGIDPEAERIRYLHG